MADVQLSAYAIARFPVVAIASRRAEKAAEVANRWKIPTVHQTPRELIEDPNVEIVGSYFPGWMISLAIGVALTVVAHYLLRKQGLHHVLGAPVLIYPGMVLLSTCLGK